MFKLPGETALKAIAIIAVAGVVSFGGMKMYNTIKDNGRYETVIESQRDTIKNKQEQIEGLKDQIELQDKFIDIRDKDIKDLETRLEGITENLGADKDDQAPEALKEYFRRLGKL